MWKLWIALCGELALEEALDLSHDRLLNEWTGFNLQYTILHHGDYKAETWRNKYWFLKFRRNRHFNVMPRISPSLFRKRTIFRALKDSISASLLEQIAFGFCDEALWMRLCQHLPAGTSTRSRQSTSCLSI